MVRENSIMVFRKRPKQRCCLSCSVVVNERPAFYCCSVPGLVCGDPNLVLDLFMRAPSAFVHPPRRCLGRPRSLCRSQIVFEVKPWDTETDLKELFGKICAVRIRMNSSPRCFPSFFFFVFFVIIFSAVSFLLFLCSLYCLGSLVRR